MDKQKGTRTPVTLFYSSAPEDASLCDQLDKHLSLLREQGLIITWHARLIPPGTDTAQVTNTFLSTASIILLLISPDFLASDYYYNVEMKRALERQKNGESYVIPVLLRSVDRQGVPFERLQSLPSDGRPVTSWSDQDEAFHDVAQGIRQVVEHLHKAPDKKPLPPLPAWRVNKQISPVSRTNRERMLKRVYAFWIKGVLEPSLHHETLIELGLHEQPNAVENPWRLVMQETNRPKQPLPAGTRIMQVYDEADGKLLILGKPGVGKTTLLLELVCDLLERAEADQSHQIPVVFFLSSWAQKRLPLALWLVEELYTKYQVPRKVGQQWVDANALLLLLDGFDEIRPAQRTACIDAINTYRRDHTEISIVVCSRTEECLAEARRLELNCAVEIQPLTEQQIAEYLESAGEQLEGLQDAFLEHPALLKMAAQPLMLNVLALTYQGKTVDALAKGQTAEKLRQKVFEAYVNRMLNRRVANKDYSQRHTLRWLRWLAQQLIEHNQTVFLLERMQPDWLPRHRMVRTYHILASSGGALFAILVGMLSPVIYEAQFPSLGENLCFKMIMVLLSVHGFGVATDLIQRQYVGGTVHEKPIEPVEMLFWERSRLSLWLKTGVPMGLLFGLIVWFLERPLIGVLSGLSMMLIVLLSGGLLFGLGDGTLRRMLDEPKQIVPNEGIWRSARNGLLIALLEILGIGLLTWVMVWQIGGSLTNGLFLALLSGLIGGLVGGGQACIQHTVLRMLLWSCGSTPRPWNYVRFFDYATERILLRRVGGGYMFTHRLLLEYFAQSATPNESVGHSSSPSSVSNGAAKGKSGQRNSPVKRASRRAKRAKSRRNHTGR
jgi:NACHT domain/TIR domain